MKNPDRFLTMNTPINNPTPALARPRYLTKSRFKLGLECPTKLFYTKKPEYADQKMEDPFLQALADSGYQVGELAKHYFPGGHDITTLDYEEAERETIELLKQDKVILYEPAVRFGNLFIRIDILVKTGKHLQLIEVKAKSIDASAEDLPFIGKRGGITREWRPYLEDVAFQQYVLRNAYPECLVSSYLMLTDKSALCPTDGLNGKFLISRDKTNRKGVKVSALLNEEDLSPRILAQTNVDDMVRLIQEGEVGEGVYAKSFVDQVAFLSNAYRADSKVDSPIAGRCGKCEFRCRPEDEAAGLKSGYRECLSRQLGWSEADFEEPTVYELNGYRKKDEVIRSGRLKLAELTDFDLSSNGSSTVGLSQVDRQRLQIEKVKNRDSSPYLDKNGLAAGIRNLVYPLHFIDFETTTVAIPFSAGRRPYEMVAFQYSHHMLHRDGSIAHAGEYLDVNQIFTSNYEFVRSLKMVLSRDKGSIFRYCYHENTVLNTIYGQLRDDPSRIPDRNDLCDFIRSITKNPGKSAEAWEGERCMIDLWDWVKRFYYDPFTHGSNSMKYVLPAILNASTFLQEKYSRPIYGAEVGIPSRNFTDWAWVVKEGDGSVRDPYKLLPKLFEDASEKDYDILSEEDELGNGGAAMTAYARMQFTEISDYEREELRKGLLKYCELDTMAMVMLFEGWQDMTNYR